MCGRYTLAKPIKSIQSHFEIIKANLEHKERYNIAPSQTSPVVLLREGQRELISMVWGLIPGWAKDEKIGQRMINARGETIHEKPSFKHSFKNKRCLIPADGFIEWEKTGAERIPHFINLKSNDLFAFAGIWSEWKHKEKTLQTYSIITTEANSLLKSLHHRMPVILSPNDYPFWLDPSSEHSSLHKLLSPFPSEKMATRQISKEINSPKNDRAECLFPFN